MTELRGRLTDGIVAAVVALAALLTLGGSARADAAVDLELLLAVDASSSVDDQEFQLQMRGLSEAFRHPAVQAAIRGAGDRGIAVALMQWSDHVTQVMSVGWRLVRDAAGADAFADRIADAGRAIPGGGTAIYGAINFSVRAMARNGFDGRRRIVDVSGDGRSDLMVPTVVARDQAVTQGIAINGLVILNDYPMLDKYYARYVIGGTGAFVMTAADYDAFAAAIIAKLIREIAEAPIASGPPDRDNTISQRHVALEHP